jgi:hypothetical protein
MKGDKNMVYFYNCQVTVDEITFWINGAVEYTSQIKSIEEYADARNQILKEILKLF